MINLGKAIIEIYMFSYNEDISHLVETTETLRWYSCLRVDLLPKLWKWFLFNFFHIHFFTFASIADCGGQNRVQSRNAVQLLKCQSLNAQLKKCPDWPW